MKNVDYSLLDRVIHRCAFAAPFVQDTFASLESSLWEPQLTAMKIEKPIFICSLPRAGTTLLLQILAQHEDCVSQTYRDMPFVRSPVLWRTLTKRFWAAQQSAERSHKDGMQISADSVEAFEEVAWMRFFPELFSDAGIKIAPDLTPAVKSELAMHMKRVLVAAAATGSPGTRYLSKNNANISRTDAISSAFPDGVLLVPIRHPVAQARSLHRQYLNFLAVHEEDNFALGYMRDLGHFEFGLLHRPLLFPGVESLMKNHAPEDLSYWLNYWRVAFEYLESRKDLILIDYDRLYKPYSIEAVFEAAALPLQKDTLKKARDLVNPPRKINFDNGEIPGLDAALKLYQKLRRSKNCVNRSQSRAAKGLVGVSA